MRDDSPAGTSRRQYLAGTAVVGVVALAGCTSAEETPPGIGQLEVENRRDQPVEASIAYRQDGDRHETSVSLETIANGGPIRQTVSEPWMGEHGDWELEVDAGGVEAEQYSSDSFDERFYDWDGTDCLLISVRIDDGIDITPRTVAVECG